MRVPSDSLPTGTAATTPRIGTELALRNASELALIAAAERPSFHVALRGQLRLCTTSWTRVRGFLVRMSEGSRLARMVAARALASVAGTLDRGRTETSNVAFEGCSTASLTSIGPESDAKADVSPVWEHKIFEHGNNELETHRRRIWPSHLHARGHRMRC